MTIQHKVNVPYLTFIHSVTIGESDRLLELPSQLPQSLHEGNRDEDNEAEIGEYLTLAQLGSILRELAVKGKTPYLKHGMYGLRVVKHF